MSIIHFESEIDHDQASAALTEACGNNLDFSLSRLKCNCCANRIWSISLWSIDGNDATLFKQHRVGELYIATNSALIAINAFRQERRFNEIILEQIERSRRSSSVNPLSHASTGPAGQEVKAA
jgi:hypothetical protein